MEHCGVAKIPQPINHLRVIHQAGGNGPVWYRPEQSCIIIFIQIQRYKYLTEWHCWSYFSWGVEVDGHGRCRNTDDWRNWVILGFLCEWQNVWCAMMFISVFYYKRWGQSGFCQMNWSTPSLTPSVMFQRCWSWCQTGPEQKRLAED